MKDILISLATYPDATSEAALESAVNMASWLGASLTGLAVEVDIRVAPNALADLVLDLRTMVSEAEGKSHDAAGGLCRRLAELGRAAGVDTDSLTATATPPLTADVIARHARLHDMAVFAVKPNGGGESWRAGEVVFSSGRPVLIVPEKSAPHAAPGRIAVAWDYSRAAARALADAMPLLRRAGEVHLVCVTDEKDVPARNPDAVRRHLGRHGVTAAYDEVKAAGRNIHDTLRAHVEGTGSDLLVMGAFGHARLRQFVLGGATKSLLEDPYVPTLLSH